MLVAAPALAIVILTFAVALPVLVLGRIDRLDDRISLLRDRIHRSQGRGDNQSIFDQFRFTYQTAPNQLALSDRAAALSPSPMASSKWLSV